MAKTVSKIGTNPLDFLAREGMQELDLGTAVAPPPPSGPSQAELTAAHVAVLERRCRSLEADNDALRGQVAEHEGALAQAKTSLEAGIRHAGLQGMAAGFVLTLLLFGLVATFAG